MAENWNHRGFLAIDDGAGPSRYHPNSSDMFSGKFPEGLRVLLFDEDPQYLHILEKHLQEFQYEVTRCNEEERAMYLLRNHRNRFDIAIIEAQNSDGDRFRLISEIGSEMDLPIIIISKDDSVESVINWMRNGACDYLIKPIRPEDLRLIFKHVAKKIQVRTSVAVAVAGEAEEKAAAENSSSVGDSTVRNPNKRKRSIFLEGQDNEGDHDHTRDSTKKRRVVWDEELHNKFIEAVQYLGIEKAVPKRILERMNVDGITRENVASHLQKFRMNLKKQKDQNEKDERNQFLITPQEGEMYSGEGATGFYNGRNVQFLTHHINNIPQPSSVQQQSTNPNLMTQLKSPLGHHHHDGVSVAVSGRNLVMTHQHQHHHHHQNSEFASIENAEENLVYNEDEDGVTNLTGWLTQNLEETSLFHFHESVIATTMFPNDNHLFANPQQMMNVHEAHEPSILRIPSFPSSFTHSSFLDQQETITMVDVSGGFNYNSDYSVNSNIG